ncbi:MAG: hypothetical protein U1C48_12480 [Methylotenera sp.]|jgi:hypothetical protein|nr:hypothetical protein [Methylotenera sp.]PKO52515.1 MAG: hypothetical protein CVU27_03705 [Betaproteobacteria bacterium HGW-Betaproteobacteria-20]
MSNNDPRHTKFKEHIKAIEEHKSLLEKQHVDADVQFDDIKASLENLAITLEEYMKVIGIP